MDSEMKLREVWTVWRDIFRLMLSEVKADIKNKKQMEYRTLQQISAPPACCHQTPACPSEVRISLPHDAARPAEWPCATLVRATFKNKPPSRQKLLFLNRTHASIIAWLLKTKRRSACA